MDTLQAQQSELEKARAASLCRRETNALGGRARLSTGEGADKQVSEMTEPLLRVGSCSWRKEGEEEFAECEARVGSEPISCARFSGQDVADIASEANAELKTRRLRTLRQMRERQHLVAWSTLQALQLIVPDRSCWPEVVDGVGGHMDQCCLLCSRTMPQHSTTEIDHGRTSEVPAFILSAGPLGE